MPLGAASRPIEEGSQKTVAVPAPTAWPLVLAFGVALVFAGLATSAAVSILGAAAAVLGSVGWFRAVLPHEAHEAIRTSPEPAPAAPSGRSVIQLNVARGSRRAWLPVEIYPIKAGIRGGVAGGAAMAVIASLYGLISGYGIWYPVNLLAAGFFPGFVNQTPVEIGRFAAGPFAIACVLHSLTSVLVGVLYGAMLPILPRRPIVLAGLAAPLLWSALLHSLIGISNPILNQRIDWLWFVMSQIGFGIVAGIIVSRQQRIPTWQGAPLAIRAGLEASGLADESGKDESR